MALASFQSAKSVVALSNSPLFQHQFSSISKAIDALAKDERELKWVCRLFKQQWLRYFPPADRNHLQTDVVNIFREHSPCLKERQFRHKANNVIVGNKPLGIGYPLSFINLADFQSSWSIPFDVRRVRSNEDEAEVAAEQLKAICEREEFLESLNINAADSQYGVAKYITKVNEIGNLVNVIRLRHGNKVFESVYRETGGAPQIYGGQYYLTEESGWKQYRKKKKTYGKYLLSIYEKEADESAVIEKQTRKGKPLRIELRRWSGMKMRTKKGHSMKDVEFEIVGIKVLHGETGERVFKRDIFAAVVGERRAELTLEEVAEEYYHRFDLEGVNRFMKQNLFLESYQTPDLQHLDNWTLVVQEAMWLLWAASKEVENVCEKWQKYSQPKRKQGERKTASQTRKGAEQLFLTFEKEAYQPKKCRKGVGRKKGSRCLPRKQYKVVKKWGVLEEITKPRPQKE
jgi:DDE superfamily endonuclease